jgi:hypothetical protein
MSIYNEWIINGYGLVMWLNRPWSTPNYIVSRSVMYDNYMKCVAAFLHFKCHDLPFALQERNSVA